MHSDGVPWRGADAGNGLGVRAARCRRCGQFQGVAWRACSRGRRHMGSGGFASSMTSGALLLHTCTGSAAALCQNCAALLMVLQRQHRCIISTRSFPPGASSAVDLRLFAQGAGGHWRGPGPQGSTSSLPPAAAVSQRRAPRMRHQRRCCNQ